MSNDISKESFWMGKLRNSGADSAASFFDKANVAKTIIQMAEGGPGEYGLTHTTDTVNSDYLHQAALKCQVATDTIILTAWAILVRSYSGEDETNGFGVYLDSKQLAWLSGSAISGDERLLKAMSSVQKDVDFARSHGFESLAALAQGTGCRFMSTTVYISSRTIEKPVEPTHAMATLYIGVVEGATVKACLSFSENSLSLARASSVVDNFCHVLGELTTVLHSAKAEQLMVRDIDVVSDNDYERISKFCGPLPSRLDACVHDLVLARCVHPYYRDRTAISGWDGAFTYAELEGHVLRIAGIIADAAEKYHPGGSRQFYVPFCLTKSKWTPVAVLAILAAGGTCVPIEPSHPPARRNQILTEVNAALVVSNKELCSGIKASLPSQSSVQDVICIDECASGSPPLRSLPSVHPEDLAYIIFTSGSTGVPKGVKWPHHTLTTSVREHNRELHLKEESTVLQFASHVFDISVSELIPPLLQGGRVAIPSEDVRLDPDSLAEFMEKMEVNWAFFTPGFARLMQPGAVPSLKTLVLGGESIGLDNIDRWAPTVDRLIMVWGPAEACMYSSKYEISARTKSEIPWKEALGFPIAGRLMLADASNPDRLVPIGALGEIIVEGPNLAEGYLNDEAKTSKSFIENPGWTRKAIFRGENSSRRFYRTGDLARQGMDGNIFFVGRADFQVKINGQRIELGEVRFHIMNNLPKAVDVLVDLVTQEDQKSLAAFLSFGYSQDSQKDIQPYKLDRTLVAAVRDMIEKIRQALTPASVPSFFIPLAQFPYTTSQKVDRQRMLAAAKQISVNELTASYWNSMAASNSGEDKGSCSDSDRNIRKQQPRSEIEVVMRTMWAAVLHMPESEIGCDENFVSLGGDSIKAIKLVALAKSSGFKIAVFSIFQSGTISALCASLGLSPSTDTRTPELDVASSISLRGSVDIADISLQCGTTEEYIEDVYPCTALQEGMVSLTEKLSTAYISHHVMTLPPWIDISLFRRAWEDVVNSNAILRTRIVPAGLQVVIRSGLIWKIPASDDLEAYIREDLRDRMGFGTALSRQTILHSPARFVWTAHHAIYDGWSLPLLANSISRTYEKLAPSTRLQKNQQGSMTSFKHFIQYIAGIDKAKSEEYWLRQLANADPAAFPPGLPSSYQPLADSVTERKISLPRERRTNNTITTMVRAAWTLLISAYSGSSTDIVFGSVTAGRSIPLDGVLELIGPTLATVPMRVILDPKERVMDLLTRIQTQSIIMMEFEQYGLQNIQRLSPTAAMACKFQSLLVVHPHIEDTDPGSNSNTAGNRLSWSGDREELNFLTAALTLACQPSGSGLDLLASYDSSVIDVKQMQRMLGTFEHIILQLFDNPDTLIRDIDTLSPSDKSEIAELTRNLPPCVDECVHTMFERRATKAPNAKAVSAWDGDFTYGELDQLSTNISSHLQSLGIRPNSFVPFCFEKSKWVLVALLGILKAGGACVPLDPSQPLDRLRSIISNTDADIILTSSRNRHILRGLPDVKSIIEVSEKVDEFTSSSPPRCEDLSPDSVCYTIFTSGSTGTPKGVVWTHSALCTSMVEHGTAFNFSSNSRVLQFSSHTFDVSVSELFTTLTFGGCVCIPDEFTRLNSISDFITEKNINWAFFAPSFARLVDPESVPTLRTLVLGGEAAGRDNIERWSRIPSLELIVTYGPSETCIYCAKNSVSGAQAEGSIGHSIGGVMWIADLGRPTKLAPIGAVGEIAIEGSILGRGYLKDPEKTAASFRHMPSGWAESRSSRIYHTGDLGRINSDGTVSCLGRRDQQVKIRGQRVELADIEYHLRKDKDVREALVLYLEEGLFSKQLVGLLSVTTSTRQRKVQVQDDMPACLALPASEIELADPEFWKCTFDIQERISHKVPAHMVPSIWIVIKSLPHIPASQKADRKKVEKWVKKMDHQTRQTIAALSSGKTDEATEMNNPLQERVREIWSEILNVSPEVIGLSSSFLRLGGDSISAMQIVACCRNAGINVSVQDLLKTKNIAEFCERATLSMVREQLEPLPRSGPNMDSPFDLSPIQSLFMTLAPNGENHFNQSHLLRFTEEVAFEDIQKALQIIVQRHAMLRARFQKIGDDANANRWQQYISADASRSFICREFYSVTVQQATLYASESQESLNIFGGPLMAADVYNMTDGTSTLFITCHHLVIDLVSWRIVLQELEEILRTGRLARDKVPLAFSTWCQLLTEHTESLDSEEVTYCDITPVDFEFWGLSMAENTAARVVERSFSLDESATKLLLGQCNEAFRTETLDLLLTAVAHSFNQVFQEVRDPIPVFNEGHGREPWRPDLDLSSTVGWFTTMAPILLPHHNSDILLSLQQVKDFRRRIPEGGLSFFTSFAKSSPSPVEITFNYFGRYQQLEREGALFNRMNWPSSGTPSETSTEVVRFSLFDICASIEKDILTINFAYSNLIRLQSLVHAWIEACSSALDLLIKTISQLKESSLTLSDLPHLSVTYDELSSLLNTALPNAGLSVHDVQNIYPCSPMQQTLLMSQVVDKTLYSVRYIWEAVSTTSEPVSLDRMILAWAHVVKIHPMLRTVFVQALPTGEIGKTVVYNQVVLKQIDPSVTIWHDAKSFPNDRYVDLHHDPPHHLTVCQQGSGKLLIQFDASHAVIDGTSVNILLRHLAKAYDNSLAVPAEVQDCYGCYVSYLKKQDHDVSRQFWKSFLENLEPCHFPHLRTLNEAQERALESVPASQKLECFRTAYPAAARLHSSCATAEITPATIFKLAWALLLRAYTGNNFPSFGYLASGRDLPIAGIEESIGPFINMLVCKICLQNDNVTVEKLLKDVQSDYVTCLPHQFCSLAEIQRVLGLSSGRLFNTVISVQKIPPLGSETCGINLVTVGAEDPSEFDIVLNLDDSASHIDIEVTYNSAFLSSRQAERLVAGFIKSIDEILDSLALPLRSVDVMIPEDYDQINRWNGTIPSPVSTLCDTLIAQNLVSRPDMLAVSGWDHSLTYSELDELAARLAERLVSDYSVRAGDMIPFCFEKSAWSIVIMIGIMKAGAAFVPLDPEHPTERLAYITQSVNTRLVIFSEKTERRSLGLVNSNTTLLVLRPDNLRAAKETPATVSMEFCRRSRSPADPAYCLFTSGSTGTPKGVLVQHEAMCTSCISHGQALGFNDRSRCLQFASYTFDACIAEIFTTLIAGGCVCVPSDQQRMDPSKLTGFINEEKVNISFLTPSFLGLLDPLSMPSFTTLVVGGEAVGQELVDRWQISNRRVINGYGPTECCVFCVIHDYKDRRNNSVGQSIIGKSVGSVCWIASPHNPNSLVPIGGIGELLVEGPILAKGYLDDQLKTASTFISTAWMESGRRAYRTGDLVRYQDDGTIEYIGRGDNQVKLRGQRLELGEIDQTLLRHPDVAQCASMLPNGGLCDGKIVVVVNLVGVNTTHIAGVLSPTAESTEGIKVLAGESVFSKLRNLYQSAADALPAFMVPSCWIVTDQLPLLSSGKANRRFISSCISNMNHQIHQLSVQSISTPEASDKIIEEQMTPLAKALRVIWSRVLNIPEQRINPFAGSFIRMGGDSISAMEVVACCRAQAIPILIEDVLKASSIAKLALTIDQENYSRNSGRVTNGVLENGAGKSGHFEDEPSNEELVLFGLSPIQRMFMKLNTVQNHFNQSFALRFSRNEVDVSECSVRSALNAIVQRHAMLRARFQKLGRSFKQWIEPVADNSYLFYSTHIPTPDRFPKAIEEVIQTTQRSLNLLEGPVFAAVLFTYNRENYMFLTAHHLVVDLVSWRIILKDFEDHMTHGHLSDFQSLPFEKWCGLLNTRRRTLLEKGEKTFLPFELPKVDYHYWGMAGVPNYARDSAEQSFTLTSRVTQALLGPCNNAFGTDVLDLFIAAIIRSFETNFPDRDLPPVYNEGHGREPWDDSLDISRTVGWFTTICPVWIDRRKCNGYIEEYVKQVKDVRRRIPQKGFSYFSSLDLEHRAFTAEVCFNYFGQFQQLERPDSLMRHLRWRDIGIDPCEASEEYEKFSLIDITAEVVEDQLVFTFSFNSQIRNTNDIRQWASNCQQILEQIAQTFTAKEPEHTITDFNNLPECYDLQVLRDSAFKYLGIAETNVSDIYPCSPVQQGMLLSQSKDSEMYWYTSIYEVHSSASTPVRIDKLREAWKMVVKRHTALRTLFVGQNSTDGLYDQVVLCDYEPDILQYELDDDVTDQALLDCLGIRAIPPDILAYRKPQHQLWISRHNPSARVFCSFLFNHAIVDGSSMAILLRDFRHAYEGRLVDEVAPGYKNYISYLKSRDTGSDIAYWKQALKGITPCFLPSDAPPSSVRTQHRVEVHVKTADRRSQGIHADIQAVARQLRVSPFTILQIAWALTLRDYTNQDQDDYCFGVVTSGRALPIEGVRDIVGPLINIMATAVNLPDNKPISQIAEAVHNNLIDNMSHQTSSLAEITHGLGSGPLFNTGMTLQRIYPEEKSSVISLKAMGGDDPTEFDMVVHALDNSEHMDIHLSYWNDKITDGRAYDIANSFASILSQILQQPEIAPLDLTMASDQDVQQLWTWNSTLPPACDIRIEELVSQQVAEHPFRDALCSSEETLSYEQVDQLSTEVARVHLAEICQEDIIPLCFERSVWVAIAMLAVLKAGGVVVLLDPAHPPQRLDSIIKTVSPKLILSSPAQAEMCSRVLGIQTLVVSRSILGRHSFSDAEVGLKRSLSPADAAYVVFTSGSTGTPKGSVTEHRSFCTATQSYHQAIGQLPGTRVLQFASYSFDASFLEILGSLMVGATVCIPTEKERSDSLSSFMNRFGVTFAVITPSVASLLAPEDVTTLSCLALCGEPMTVSHIEKWVDKVRLVNAFGPSECCVGSAANPRLTKKSSPKCIGWAVACCYWVVHPKNHNKLARIGSTGELLIEGHILARHYLGQDSKTNEAFITNPDWARPGRGTRLYKTGDLVYQNPDGSFQYVGRKDTQAKLHGQRFELEDIEQAFRDVIPSCESVAAEVIGAPARIVLFFSTQKPNADLDSMDVQSEMSKKLPSYMVPSDIVSLSNMPLMSSGKIDRKKIRELAVGLPIRAMAQKPGRVAETPMEVILASLWKEVMNIEKTVDDARSQFSADDNFFEIGGDSYTAMKLVTRARAKGVALNVASIMQTPRLADMAKTASLIPDSQHSTFRSSHTNTPFNLISWNDSLAKEVARQCHVSTECIEDVYPCSPLQEGLFILSVKRPGAYVARLCYRLPSYLDLDRYRAAWSIVYDSVQILRTHIVQLDDAGSARTGDSGLFQAVVKKPLVWQNASSFTDQPAGSFVSSIGKTLVEFSLFSVSEGSRYMILTMHHATYDASSIRKLFDMVDTAYKGGQLPDAHPFKNFIKHIQGSNGPDTREFWTRYLDGAQASTYPRIPAGYIPSADSELYHDFVLPESKSNVHTTSTVIRVAWAIVLAQYMETDDVVFGETFAGRNTSHSEVNDADGPVITTVPVRFNFRDDQGVQSVLSTMQTRILSMTHHQQAGLQNIKRMSTHAASGCEFTCLIVIVWHTREETALGLGIASVEGPRAPAIDYPLVVEFARLSPKDMRISVAYDQRLIVNTVVRSMVNQFVSILYQLSDGGQKTIRDIKTSSQSNNMDGMNTLCGEPDKQATQYGVHQVTDNQDRLLHGDEAASTYGQDMSRSLAYWTDLLRDARPCHFPVLSSSAAHDRKAVTRVLPNADCIRLFCRSHDLPMANLLQLAWALVLRAYIGSDSICFGYLTSSHGLRVNSTTETVKPLTSMLICHIRLGDNNYSALDVLQQLKVRFVDSLPHRYCSLADIHHALGVGNKGLFNTIMTMQNTTSEGEILNGQEVKKVGGYDTSKFNIVLDISDDGEAFHLQLLYCTDYISESCALDLVEGTIKALNAIVAEPVRSLPVNLLSDGNSQLIQQWNRHYPSAIESTIPTLIGQHVAETPNAAAIASWDGELTYAELDDAAGRLASHLRTLGVGPEVAVPLCFQKSLWAVVAMLAVLKAGGAFVPLDPAHPIERIQNTVEQLQSPPVALASSDATHLLVNTIRGVIVLDRQFYERLLPSHDGSAFSAATPDNMAYILFTSGSTGSPKGVVLEHRAVCTGTTVHGSQLHYTRDSRVLQFSSYGFDASIGEIITTLVHGGCVCILSEDERLNSLTASINRLRVNWMFLTPAVASMLSPDEFPEVRTLTVGGDLIGHSVINKWKRASCRLIQVYGPSECCVYSLFEDRTDKPVRPEIIGKAMACTTWVVDPRDPNILMPVGAMGELLIQGPIQARGYLNDPSKTQKTFLKNLTWLPSEIKHERLYLTGDLVRYNENGSLSFIKRKDTQVKVHGQRIELSEIDYQIAASHDEIETHLALLVSEGQLAGKIVVVLAFHNLGSHPRHGSLKLLQDKDRKQAQDKLVKVSNFLANKLPQYMHPFVIVVVNSLPMTISGKIDSRRVAAWIDSLDEKTYNRIMNIAKTDKHVSSGQAPSVKEATGMRTEKSLETEMKELWAAVLKIDAEKLCYEDNFFHLGGDSITAMRLVADAGRKAINIKVADIFHHPVLGDLCKFGSAAASPALAREAASQGYDQFMTLSQLGLSRDGIISEACNQLSVFPADIEDIYPATDYQAWAAGHRMLRSRGNTNYFLFHLYGNLDTSRLEKACKSMVESNPILRTHFTIIEGRVMQVILRSYQAEFSRYRQGQGDITDDIFIQSLVEQDAKRPTDMSEPIVRFKLVLHSPDHYVLVMRISHAQYDGVSLPLLCHDLKKCYRGQPLPQRHPFGRFVWEVIANEDKAVEFWTQHLVESSMTELIQHSKPSYINTLDTLRTRHISPIPFTVAGISQATLVKAAWAVVLAQISNQRDIVFGNLIFGRNIPVSGIESICGPCVNIVPVRVRLDSATKALDLLNLIQDQQRAAIPYENLGFRQLIERCTDWPPWTRFSSIVQHQKIDSTGAEEFALDDSVRCRVGALGAAYDSCDIWVKTTPLADSFEVELGFCGGLALADMADSLLDDLCNALSFFANLGSGGDRSLQDLISGLKTPCISATLQSRAKPIASHNDAIPPNCDIPEHMKPLLPAIRAQVDEVWRRVLPITDDIPLDTPYYDIWGNDLAALRFVEEYARQDINFDIEYLVQYPTKHLQTILAARILAGNAPKKGPFLAGPSYFVFGGSKLSQKASSVETQSSPQQHYRPFKRRSSNLSWQNPRTRC